MCRIHVQAEMWQVISAVTVTKHQPLENHFNLDHTLLTQAGWPKVTF